MFTSLTNAVEIILERSPLRGDRGKKRLAELSGYDAIALSRDDRKIHAKDALARAVADGDLSAHAHFRGDDHEPAEDTRKLVPRLLLPQLRRAFHKVRYGPHANQLERRLFHSDFWFNSEELTNWLEAGLPPLPTSAVASKEAAAIMASFVADGMTRKVAFQLLKEKGHNYPTTGDRADEVWRLAREKAGLPKKGRPGRPRKKIEAN